MIEIFGRATSSNVQLVMWAAAELGIDVTRHDIGHSYGGTNTPEFLAMNPNAKVPVMRDGALVMFEAAAILRYLAAEYGTPPFWPATAAARAPLDIWAEWTKTTFGPTLLLELFYPLVRYDPATVSAETIRSGEAKVATLATMLSNRIGDGPYLAGADLTWADIMTGHLLYRYYELPFERADLPDLARYYDRLCERPAYRDHVQISYEPLRFKGEH